jgi:U3 small nucleolar RNA-associated protein 22
MGESFAAAKLVDVDGFFVRIIPSATSIFNIAKLNLTRNNIHNSNNGMYLQCLNLVSLRFLLLLLM